MSRFAPARLSPDAYPHHVPVETRFQDLDPLGHINNVAMAALFEQARVRFNRQHLLPFGRHEQPHVRWLVARVDVNYLAEAHFPDPVDMASGIGRVGGSSWTMLSAGFQQGRCVALCDTVIVYTANGAPAALPDALRSTLGNLAMLQR